MLVCFLLLIFMLTIELNPFKSTIILVFASRLVSFSAFLNLNKWMAWGLLLFYLGGIIILFIYTVSMVILEKLDFTLKEFYFSITLILLLIISISNHWNSSETMMGLAMAYKVSRSLVPLLTLALLGGLLVVVRITNSLTGPIKSLSHA